MESNRHWRLSSVVKIKVNSRVMLTADLSDRLVNGQLGTVKHFSKNLNGEVTKIDLKFDDAGAGPKKIDKDTFAKQHSWVLVEKFETDIKLKASSYVATKITHNNGLGMYFPQSARVKPPKESY